jgi:hypothetical protein
VGEEVKRGKEKRKRNEGRGKIIEKRRRGKRSQNEDNGLRKGERGREKMKMEWHIVCKSCG